MKIRVMIVDDELLMRALLRKIIEEDEKIRFEVVSTAVDGQHAINKLKEIEVDVLLMDTKMPRLNGFDSSRIIKQTNNVSIVLLNKLTKNSSEKIIYHEVDDVISIPINELENYKLQIREVLYNAKKNKS